MALATSNTITISEALMRKDAVSNALTDLRLEGLKPSAAVLELLDSFAGGDIDESDLLHRVLNR